MKRRELVTLLGRAAAGGARGAARLRHAARRRGGCVATCSARAAAGDAGDRVPKRHVARGIWTFLVCLSARFERSRLRREPQRRDRIPLGGGPLRSPAGIGGRSRLSGGNRG